MMHVWGSWVICVCHAISMITLTGLGSLETDAMSATSRDIEEERTNTQEELCHLLKQTPLRLHLVLTHPISPSHYC